MTRDAFNFTPDFESLILAAYIRYPDQFFCRGELLQPAYFSSSVAVVTLQCVHQYHNTYGHIPTWEILGQMVTDALESHSQDPKEALDYLHKLRNLPINDTDYIVTRIVQFCRERATLAAVRTVAGHLRDGTLPPEGCTKLFEDALHIGENLDDLGYLLHHSVDTVVDKVTQPGFGVRTGIPQFDAIWRTGWAPGWLIALVAPPKRYKCLGKDTPVMMYDGSVKHIQDIKVGDLVMGDDSTPRRVLTAGKGQGPLFEVSQKSGAKYVSKFICNDAHVLCVQLRDGKTVKEITAQDYYETDPIFKHYWRAYRTGIELPEKVLPLEPYYLGLWLGDGVSYCAHITVGDSDPEIGQYIEDYAARLGMRVSKRGGISKCTGFSIIMNRPRPNPAKNQINETLKCLNLVNNKHIPDSYKFNSRKNRLELLAGLIDSDGHRNGSRFIFTNTNKKLAEDVHWLARSLGFRSNICQSKTGIKSIGYTGTCWKVSILGQINTIPIKVARKKIGPNSLKCGTRYPIKLKPIGVGDYYGITIDGNERFLLGDFTVTHNTTFALNIALSVVGHGVGEDVLYYACEISQEQAILRALHNLSGLNEDVMFDSVQTFKAQARQAIADKIAANLLIKHFPIGTATIGDLKAHAKMVTKQLGLNPKMIVIDYADTVKSSDPNQPPHIQQASIYKESIAFGKQFNSCVVLPDRCTAEAVERRVPNLKSFQGAFAKGGIVDVAMSPCATDVEYSTNILRTFVFINRHGPAFQHFRGSVDPSLSKIVIGDEIPYSPDDEDENGENHGTPRQTRGRSSFQIPSAFTEEQ